MIRFNPTFAAPVRALGKPCASRGRSWRAAAWLMCAMAAVCAHAQAVPAGSLLVTVRQTAHLTFAFENGTPGCTLTSGAGTRTATLNLGTASIARDSLTCVTYTAGSNGTSYTLGDTIYVKVTKTGTTASYTLTAKLATAAPTGVQWAADSKNLSTTAATLTTTGPYGSNLAVGLAVTVQHTVTTSNIGDVIDFTATAN